MHKVFAVLGLHVPRGFVGLLGKGYNSSGPALFQEKVLD